jgi:hypothetical protein
MISVGGQEKRGAHHNEGGTHPNTNSIASITLDLPEPFGPTTDEKHCGKSRGKWEEWWSQFCNSILTGRVLMREKEREREDE